MSARNELLKPLDHDQVEREKDEWIKSQAEFLMSAGQKCDPYNMDNCHESLTQMDMPDMCMYAAYVKHASDGNICSSLNLSDFIVRVNNRYWLKMAEFLANKEWDEKIS